MIGTLDRVLITELTANPTDDERRAALGFVADVESRVGTSRLSDHLRLDLGRAAADANGPLIVTVRAPDGEDTSGAGRIVGLAQVSPANEAAIVEVVVDPVLDDQVAVRDDALDTAIEAHRRHDAAPIVWWVDDPSDHDTKLAARFGLSVWRELFEMRRALPHPDRATITTRDFKPGVDDEAWVRVNNRAFAGHGEQGGWTVDTLHLRMGEPWFDPAGFRVYERDGEIVAFCWTKIHDDDPRVGEIYVIAVDPSAHGEGLGKQLTLAGLDSIADRGITIANLYVDAGNTAAVGLYEQLGFSVHRRRVAFAPPPKAT